MKKDGGGGGNYIVYCILFSLVPPLCILFFGFVSDMELGIERWRKKEEGRSDWDVKIRLARGFIELKYDDSQP
jgi:hypothetical protein